jgi:hypothetical protein
MAKRDQLSAAAQAWDVEYDAGRYREEPPLPFVADILAAARDHDLVGEPGIYIGCGNGRNYLPLVVGGLDLTGLDISATAIAQRPRPPAASSTATSASCPLRPATRR